MHLKKKEDAKLQSVSYFYSAACIGAPLTLRLALVYSTYAAALSALFLTAADFPWGGITLHLNVEEDVPIVLPNCNVVVPFKR